MLNHGVVGKCSCSLVQWLRCVCLATCSTALCSVVVFFVLTLLSTLRLPTNPSISIGVGSVALVTGGTGGIGQEVAVGLAENGLDVVITCREGDEPHCKNETARLWAQRPQTSGRQFFIELVDLSETSSTCNLVERVKARYGSALKVLVLAASVNTLTLQRSDDGMELQYAVNVRSFFQIMVGLAPLLSANGPSSVIGMSSALHEVPNLNDWQFKTVPYDHKLAYRFSKSAQLAIIFEAAETLSDGGKVFFNAVHPGTVDSGIVPSWRIKQLAGCCISGRTAAQRSIDLALHAPAAGLQGTWWVYLPFAWNSAWLSVRLPRPSDEADAETRRRIWSYVQAALAGSHARACSSSKYVR